MTTDLTVALPGPWTFLYAIRTPSATTGALTPATGLTVTGYWSATDGGSAIAGTTTTLTELSGTPGSYIGTLSASDMVSALTSYLDAKVFEVITINGTVQTSQRYRVVPTREPS